MMKSAQEAVGAVDMIDDEEVHWYVAGMGIVARVHRYHFGMMEWEDIEAMCCGVVVVGKDVGVIAGRTNSHSVVGDMTLMIE